MTKRSVVAVILLTFVTLGIYPIYWFVKTKDEMNTRGAGIPTAWLMIVPIASIWWMWKWAGGVQTVTRGKQSQGVAFIMILLLSIIGMAVVQSWLNEAADDNGMPLARVA